MSPRKVNKEEKRREVALACSDLLHDVGIKNITVAQVAKTANIGKGTVYEYFENKHDIIFEIINIHIEKHHEEFLVAIKNIKTTREKVFKFFDFVMTNNDVNDRHFKGYKEYLSVVLSEENDDMLTFNGKCNIFFREQLSLVIENGILNNELSPLARDFVDGLMIFEKGMVLMKMTNCDFDAKNSCEKFINNFFDLLEIKNK